MGGEGAKALMSFTHTFAGSALKFVQGHGQPFLMQSFLGALWKIGLDGTPEEWVGEPKFDFNRLALQKNRAWLNQKPRKPRNIKDNDQKHPPDPWPYGIYGCSMSKLEFHAMNAGAKHEPNYYECIHWPVVASCGIYCYHKDDQSVSKAAKDAAGTEARFYRIVRDMAQNSGSPWLY